MRALDPRLLSRTRSARPLLVIDAALGVGTSVAVLVQATMLARIAAKAFHGAPLHALGRDFAWLVVAFVARGAFAWAMEVAGRRAAWDVLSELRLALVAKRLRTQPIAVDGAEGAEIATVSVRSRLATSARRSSDSTSHAARRPATSIAHANAARARKANTSHAKSRPRACSGAP